MSSFESRLRALALARIAAMSDRELNARSPLNPANRRYGRMTPTARQWTFLQLECEEALYGGAAGGAKSEGLLMWLAEGVEYPTYGGIIFRRTLTQLEHRDGLIDKSKAMYQPMGGRYDPSKHRWTFPSGATIELGNLPYRDSYENYRGPSFHRIAFDELTQFREYDYLFLMSRLRRVVGFPVRPGIRSGSNPGGPGHLWVKNRFITPEALRELKRLSIRDPSPPGAVYFITPERCFIPARIADNPYLDFDDYIGKLSHLDPITRERLLSGDWAVTENSQFDPGWFRYWRDHFGAYLLVPKDPEKPGRIVEYADCERFITVDAAATSAEVRRMDKLGERSQSVISVWDRILADGTLIWRYAAHGYWSFPQLLDELKQQRAEHRPHEIIVEDEKTGRALIQMLAADGITAMPVLPGKRDKLARALPLIRHCKDGMLYLPAADAEWRSAAEAEMLAWTGDADEPADFIDTAAYAADHTLRDSGVIVFER